MNLKPVISDEAVNTSRQVTFDFMKVGAIFFMVLIHVYEELSVFPDAASGFFGELVEFFGGPFAAPMFMIAMGLGMVYSSHGSPREMFVRGVKLFVFAYVLNFARDGIRAIVCGLAGGGLDAEELAYQICNIDILHFAGLTFMLTALLKKLDVKPGQMLLLAVVMQAIGDFLLSVSVENPFLQYFLGLFIYTSEASCFPLLLWFVYPVFGMQVGHFLKQVNDPDYFYKKLLGICFTVYLGIRAFIIYAGYDLNLFFALEDDIYYKQTFLSLLYTITLLGMVMSLVYFARRIPLMKKLEKRCVYIGNNLNVIYVNQWLIIGWLGFLFEFEVIGWLSYAWIVPVAIVIYAASIALAGYTGKVIEKFM